MWVHIARRLRNVRNDAERLAKLLYLGDAPATHVPSLEVRTWRELINCRSRLRTMPGVGMVTADALAAFIDDPPRFGDAKTVGCYFGLVPCQDQSGDQNRLGHIARAGAPVVCQLVADAAWQAQRCSPTVRAYF